MVSSLKEVRLKLFSDSFCFLTRNIRTFEITISKSFHETKRTTATYPRNDSTQKRIERPHEAECTGADDRKHGEGYVEDRHEHVEEVRTNLNTIISTIDNDRTDPLRTVPPFRSTTSTARYGTYYRTVRPHYTA